MWDHHGVAAGSIFRRGCFGEGTPFVLVVANPTGQFTFLIRNADIPDGPAFVAGKNRPRSRSESNGFAPRWLQPVTKVEDIRGVDTKIGPISKMWLPWGDRLRHFFFSRRCK